MQSALSTDFIGVCSRELRLVWWRIWECRSLVAVGAWSRRAFLSGRRKRCVCMCCILHRPQTVFCFCVLLLTFLYCFVRVWRVAVFVCMCPRTHALACKRHPKEFWRPRENFVHVLRSIFYAEWDQHLLRTLLTRTGRNWCGIHVWARGRWRSAPTCYK